MVRSFESIESLKKRKNRQRSITEKRNWLDGPKNAGREADILGIAINRTINNFMDIRVTNRMANAISAMLFFE